MKRVDLTGGRFGRLVVTSFAGVKKGRMTWNCKCDCGEEHAVMRDNLANGSTRSCGCLKKEAERKSKRKDPPIMERFFNKVFPVTESGCWLWVGNVNRQGYGQFTLDGYPVRAHRFSYERFVGPIPKGLSLDHLCRVTGCVNPAHLEPVTHRENNLRAPKNPAAINIRKTHCIRGHEFTEANTRFVRGGRNCKKCKNILNGRHRERKRAGLIIQ